MAKISKPLDNSKYERINKIYERLNNNSNGATFTELANELGVSTKTIQRDFNEVLIGLGALRYGRYWKIDQKEARDSLGVQERIIIGILDEMAKNAGKTFYGKAHSLLSQITQQLDHPIFANLDSEALDDTNIKLFEELELAIKNKNEVSFEYKSKLFQIKPLKLAFFDGFWYLLTLDSSNEDTFKKFHLKTIKNLNQLDIIFQTPLLVEDRLKKANTIWFDLTEPYDVKLLVSSSISKFFERKPLKGQSITGKDKDGSVEITIPITHEMEIVPLILWYMPHIKVLEPDWLANEIKNKVEGYLQEIK